MAEPEAAPALKRKAGFDFDLGASLELQPKCQQMLSLRQRHLRLQKGGM
jgi:hypothetical protein